MLDVALAWEVTLVLQTLCPFSDPALFQYLSAAYVQQLLLEDAWVWSCFVLLFHPEKQTRETMVNNMISRAVGMPNLSSIFISG